MTKSERMLEHAKIIQSLFPKTRGLDPSAIRARLRLIESKAEKHAIGRCNGDGAYRTMTEEQVSKITDAILAEVTSFIGETDIPIFINMDPRGYQLKVDESWMREHPDCELDRDVGGYGILAPEF